ncbi:integrase arm-type DNA-binding domain-containing protein [Uliginosibacterium sp. TH139]|uniref:tyrosine-type recombinase/integrase n=1 Tax=Uliginosibacterium sp. TH139 TaxID=2067453 RepID=UPI000C7BE9F0|nr:integrase arm-type DNA-binding domain-containing protein [Uliginosibacterium sp. TH139]PLK47287.1 integrase [Uliginosibacterium sp. TH139]
MPLTDTEIRNALPGEKPLRMFDGGGLYLEIAPSGGKWWRLKYRFDGKEKRLSLGVYPETTLKAARDKRNEARKQLEAGTDPGSARKAEKRRALVSRANSFEAVAREWYSNQEPTWVATHAKDVLRRLESNLFPTLGELPLSEVEPADLLAAVREIETRGARDLAHRVLQVAGQVFRYGVATQRCKRDPTPDLRGALKPHKARNQPAVRPEEVPALLRAIDGYEAIGDRQTRLALTLCALTFTRTTELIGAEWSEIDLDAGLWIIPSQRMKMRNEHLVPLAKQAIEALLLLQETCCGSRFVFPGRNRDKPISNNTMLFALYRLGYKGKMTGHGFRAVASTILNEQGYRPDVIERQLAHCEQNEVRGAYNRAEYLKERRTMMQEWADYLDKLKAGAEGIQPHGTAA